MFAELVRRIESRVPYAVNHAIPYRSYLYYQTLAPYEPYLLVGLLLKTARLSKRYDDASVGFHPTEFDNLSADDFLRLQHFFAMTVELAYDLHNIPTVNIASMIKPDSPSNILAHERQHMSVLPPNVIRTSRISVSFIGYPWGIDIIGHSVYRLQGISPRTNARAAIAPEVLCNHDIAIARHYSLQTNDPAFIAGIEAEIDRKPRLR